MKNPVDIRSIKHMNIEYFDEIHMLWDEHFNFPTISRDESVHVKITRSTQNIDPQQQSPRCLQSDGRPRNVQFCLVCGPACSTLSPANLKHQI